MWLAQISDMHVTPAGGGTPYSGDTGPALARCVAALCAAEPQPAAVVASGDLVNAGAPAEYARLRTLLAPLRVPVYLMPGNHDDREALRAAFPDHGYLPRAGGLRYEAVAGGLRLIMLDTVLPGEDAGTLDAGQLDWLEQALGRAPGGATMLFMHHPPIATGMRRMDAIALDAASRTRLAGIVARHPEIERIACGHVHRAAHARWAGTVVTLAPSTAFQAQADFSTPGRFTPTGEAPAYHAHHWDGAALATHTVSLPTGALEDER